MTLILASQSASRQAMLAAAGVAFEAVPAHVDETAIKAAMVGASPRDLADKLAELKAVKVSARHPGALVLGSDSLVALADGRILDKPTDRADAAAHLRAMAGGTHQLWSAAVLARDAAPLWRHVEAAKLSVRPLADAFIAAYLDAEWPAIAGCVGCFRIEGPGVQLFDRVEGSHFTILGMPLLPVLGQLRVLGALPS
ncbi:MAG: nucleoside triphosphate pyrophosphatase [Pseudomonadota bacterium]